MSNPNQPIGTQVDPSEGAIEEGAEQQGFQRADAAEGEQSSMLEVDPSEGPME
jgi:hypothetical protein